MSDNAFLLDIVANVAIYGLVAVVMGRLIRRLEGAAQYQLDLSLGAVLGVTAVVGMLFPVTVAPGIVFDGRAIAIAAAGLFGGPLAFLTSVLPPAIYRIWLGGDGVVPGLANMALAGGIGVGVHMLAMRRDGVLRHRHIFAAALALPFASFLAFPLFPTLDIAWAVFQKMGPTIAFAMPAGLVFLSLLLLDEQSRFALVSELKAKQKLVDGIHSESPALLFQRTLSAEGRPQFSYISKNAERLLGCAPDQVYRDPSLMLQAIHPDDRGRFLETIRQAEIDGQMPMHEYRAVGRDGVERWLRVRCAASRQDRRLVWTGVAIDVTEFKAIEERRSELAQLVQASVVPVIQTDANFNVRYFNMAACNLYGYEPEEIVDAPAAKFRPPERIEMMGTFMEERRCEQTAGVVETDGLHKSGRRIPVSLTFSPVHDRDDMLSGWAVICSDLTNQKEAEQELKRLATTDMLTGLANRLSFHERAGSEISRARRYKRPLVVIMADIDHFKRINDRYGHATGDAALRAVATALQDTLRGAGDFVARLGGEEFAILVPEACGESAAILAERLRSAIERVTVPVGERHIAVSASFGVAEWHAAEKTLDAALSRADAALYRAKAEGRNRVALASAPEMAPTLVADSGPGPVA